MFLFYISVSCSATSYENLLKMSGECILWPEKCFIFLSYRFSLNDHHYGLSAAGVTLEVGAFPPLLLSFVHFFRSSLSKV